MIKIVIPSSRLRHKKLEMKAAGLWNLKGEDLFGSRALKQKAKLAFERRSSLNQTLILPKENLKKGDVIPWCRYKSKRTGVF